MSSNQTHINFEASMKRLDEITSSLEKENVSLEDALKLYEEGVRLVRICNEKLEQAEQKIRILKVNADGEPTEEPFEPTQGKEG